MLRPSRGEARSWKSMDRSGFFFFFLENLKMNVEHFIYLFVFGLENFHLPSFHLFC